ncbi:MAG: nucleotidyltransferase family protein [Chitinophagales bacterium]
MKAMIFAAGLGTRLRPLTNNKPKALVEINNTTLLEYCIRRLKFFGYTDIIVNIHHFGKQIISFLEANNNFGINISISDERDLLLNTGGGLKKAASFFGENEDFLVVNVDILHNIDFNLMRKTHIENKNLVTLAVSKRKTSRYLLFDENNNLGGWQNVSTGKVKIAKASKILTTYNSLAFSGLQMVNAKIFNFMPQESVFSIIDVYLKTASKAQLMAFQHEADIWLDVGKHDALAKAATMVQTIDFA